MRQTWKPEDRVLLAGLRPVEIETATAALRAEGIRVDVVQNANQVMESIALHRPGGIVLDQDLQGISGSALCQVLRRRPETRHTPILMIMSLSDEEEIKRALDAGASDLLPRPLHGPVLARRIGTWVRLRQRESDLARNRDLLLRLASVATWEVDIAEGRFEISEGLKNLLGLSSAAEKVTIDDLLASCLPEERLQLKEYFQKAAESGEPWSSECCIQLPDGEKRYVSWEAEVLADERGRPDRISGSVQDVTDRVHAAEEMRRMAYQDSLTGLANRNAFMARLVDMVEAAKRHDRGLALLFLDLDNFKRINDSLGHAFGDQLLCSVARRFEDSLRSSDLVGCREFKREPVARLGGDEFTIVLPDVRRVEDVRCIAQRLVDALRDPLAIGDNEIFVGVSIGITMFPEHGTDVETLLRNADRAMYEAKTHGRNNIQFFSQEIDYFESRRMLIEERLKGAVERGEFQLFYQPQVDLETGEMVGVEALVRWTDDELGAVSPAEFIPVAESSGVIVLLGEWVLKEACFQASSWLAQGLPAVHMSVNISAPHFESDGLIDMLGQCLFDSGFPARALTLEITESVFSSNPNAVRRNLSELKRLGVRVALDDFGTGYSSLSYLKRFPVDLLKIDRSFVRDVVHDPDDVAITSAMISMAKALRLEVVAEGVETEKQRALLSELGCRYIQGFLVSPPVPAPRIEAMLRSRLD